MSRALACIAVGGLVALAGCGFGGGDDAGVSGAALTPPDSSWVPGQPALGSYPEFAALLGRAEKIARARRAKRELALERIERAKVAARKRASEEAKRRYLEAKRRAERAYKRALAEAARKRREQEERIRRLKEEIARKLAEREKKLRVDPGEECKLPNVRKRFHCKRGRLPDRATDGKKQHD